MSLSTENVTNQENPLLEVSNLKRYFSVKAGFSKTLTLKAVDGISFSLPANKTLAVVGESGCGKSTLAKMLMQIVKPTSGDIQLLNNNVNDIAPTELIKYIQMVFQDPYSSLNPRKEAVDIIAEPLIINTNKSKTECANEAVAMMEKVGLRPEFANRFPHMFSGGQRQRIGIARALMLQPQVLVLDEPVSALDVSVQAQVINLLIDIQKQFELSFILISHDLSVVQHLSDEILVIYLGRVVESGHIHDVMDNPKHPYTKALIASTPELKPKKEDTVTIVEGEPPSPLNPPKGCYFNPRCPYKKPECTESYPELKDFEDRKIACHLY